MNRVMTSGNCARWFHRRGNCHILMPRENYLLQLAFWRVDVYCRCAHVVILLLLEWRLIRMVLSILIIWHAWCGNEEQLSAVWWQSTVYFATVDISWGFLCIRVRDLVTFLSAIHHFVGILPSILLLLSRLLGNVSVLFFADIVLLKFLLVKFWESLLYQSFITCRVMHHGKRTRWCLSFEVNFLLLLLKWDDTLLISMIVI